MIGLQEQMLALFADKVASPRRARRKMFAADLPGMEEMLAKGFTITEIVNLTGFSVTQVYCIKEKRYTIRPDGRVSTNARNPIARAAETAAKNSTLSLLPAVREDA
jgi:hypothetical protein